MSIFWKRLSVVGFAIAQKSVQSVFCGAVGFFVAQGAVAQTLPAAPQAACQPPNAGEYLLLIVSKTPEVQAKIRTVLPNTANAIVCNYLEDVVTRVSGFSTAETANSWAQYLTETVGLQAFVARPAQAAAPQPAAIGNAPEATKTAAVSRGYNPQPLGAGYAVLVSYFNRPELAAEIQQTLAQTVGLVAYGQRPYLLAIYTTDQNVANSTLQKLSDRGFWAMVVDSRRVTLLKSAINVSPATVSR